MRNLQKNVNYGNPPIYRQTPSNLPYLSFLEKISGPSQPSNNSLHSLPLWGVGEGGGGVELCIIIVLSAALLNCYLIYEFIH